MIGFRILKITLFIPRDITIYAGLFLVSTGKFTDDNKITTEVALHYQKCPRVISVKLNDMDTRDYIYRLELNPYLSFTLESRCQCQIRNSSCKLRGATYSSV